MVLPIAIVCWSPVAHRGPLQLAASDLQTLPGYGESVRNTARLRAVHGVVAMAAGSSDVQTNTTRWSHA